MSQYGFPWVKPNQRIVPVDFLRAMGAIEDAIAHVGKHIVFDPSHSTGIHGVVLHGMAVTDVSDPGAASVSIAAGAAMLPASAGDQEARLCILPSPVSFSIDDAPPASERIDAVCVRLIGTETAPDAGQLGEDEQRDFRVLDGGVEAIQPQNTPTYRRPFADPVIVAGVADEFAPALPAGHVLLATIRVDDNGDVVSFNDVRTMMFNGPDDATSITSDGSRNYFKGLWKAWSWVQLLARDLEARVFPHIDADGDLSQTQTVHDGVAFLLRHIADDLAGNGFPVDPGSPVFDLQTRHLRAQVPPLTTGYRCIPSPTETASSDALGYTNDADGLRVNASTTVRAFAVVIPNRTVDGVHQWHGQNIESVGNGAVGNWSVTFPAALFNGPHGDLTSGKWRIRHGNGVPIEWIGGAADKLKPTEIVVYEGLFTPERRIEVDTRCWVLNAPDWELENTDVAFWVELLGPAEGGWTDVI